MGSLSLECPLCCSETFSCRNSLKYHLLSITDNLVCPSCHKRFKNIVDLATHLGDTECNENKDDTHTSENNNGLNVFKNCTKESSQTPTLSIFIKNELQNGTEPDISNSILAKALMKDLNPILIHDENESSHKNEEVQEENELYYCSTCDVRFTSLEEHIAEFHNGDIVYYKESEHEAVSVDATDTDDFSPTNDENEESLNVIDPMDLLQNTVQEEQCVDKDGRIYNRKFVKIKKFWDDTTDSLLEIAPSNSDPLQTPINIYKCSKCDTKFFTLDRYNKHKCKDMQKLDSNLYKKCKSCNACFVNTRYLIEHMKTHKPRKVSLANARRDMKPPYICDICNTEFTTFKSLRLHKRMHEPVKVKDIEPPVSYGMLGEKICTEFEPREMFICKVCNKPYDKEYEEVHSQSHNLDLSYICDICNRKFTTKENLSMHMRAHTDTKKFACSYCKKTFLTNDKLQEHILTKCHKRQYECQYCGRRFARPHEKVKHERIHTGEKPHVCEICGKAFRVSYCLTLHMRTHSGTRPYKCNHCGKRFKAHSVYNHHLLIHSEERKYKCPFCPKSFKTGVQLAGHKNSHTKPFTCTECNRPFASLYAVRSHMDTHQKQNALKYKCSLCGACYARPFALRDHIKEQHPDKCENNDEAETITFDASNTYSLVENVETNPVILVQESENILIDIGDAGVGVINMEEVQAVHELHDSVVA